MDLTILNINNIMKFLIITFLFYSNIGFSQKLAVNEKDKYTGSHTVESQKIILKNDFFNRGLTVYIRKVDSLYGLLFVLKHFTAFSISEGQEAHILLESGNVIAISSVTNSVSTYLPYTKVWQGDAGYLVEETQFKMLLESPIKSIRLSLSDHSNVEFEKIPSKKTKEFLEYAKKVWSAKL